jgi:heterotetrameric sarcosine oxidase gamma subunit
VRLSPETALGGPFGVASAIAGFSVTGTTLTERADIGCMLLTAATDAGDILEAAGASAGVELPAAPGRIEIGGGRLALWLSPRSWLVLCEANDEESLARKIQAAFSDRRLSAALFSDYLCWLDLSGKHALGCLQGSAFVSLDREGLQLRHAKRTLIADINSVIIREREEGYLLGVERSRAHYLAARLCAYR